MSVLPQKRKKPMNAFFLYRKQYKGRIQELYNTSKSHEISRIAGECWAQESPAVKNHFRRLSQELYEQQKEEELTKSPPMTPMVPSSPRKRLQSRSADSFQERMQHARPLVMIPSIPSPPIHYGSNPFMVSQDILDLTIDYSQYAYPNQQNSMVAGNMYNVGPIVNITPVQSPQVTSMPFPMPLQAMDPVFDSYLCQSPMASSPSDPQSSFSVGSEEFVFHRSNSL
jgi:hypothetical protein